MKKEFVTFKQAKTLRKKGFTKENGYACQFGWINYMESFTGATNDPENDLGYALDKLGNSHLIEMPEQWQVIEWLRTRHNIFISAHLDTIFNKGKYTVLLHNTITLEHISISNKIHSGYNLPQEALWAGIEYALKKLI